jgi:uncharacterized membrane-anchored protein YitT (DUF2179 family)
MLYRIFTENKNHAEIEKIINKYYDGYTLIKGEGFWRLQKENSLIIEIVTEDNESKVNAIAKEIKIANNQEAVLIQRIKNNQWYV